MRITLSRRQSFAARIVWIVVRLIATLWMAKSGMHFYYQGF